jgi:hypothetical protein
MAIFGKDITAADLAVGNLQGSEKEASEASKAFRYGIDQPSENIATTLRALGFDTQADALSDFVEAPEDYESAAARFINPEGEWYDYNWSELPLATVEQAGQLGGSILSRIGGAGIGAGAGSLVGPGGTVTGGIIGAFLGPTLFEAVQIAGPVAFERARNANPPREEPNAEDWAGALGTAGFSGVLNAIGIKNIGLLNSTVGKTLKAGVREGVTEAGQGFTEQIGGTGLTDAGLQIDPKAAIGEGLVGWSSGTSIQAPIATAQALQTTGGTPSTTPAAAVDQMQETVNPELAARTEESEIMTTQSNVTDFLNEAPETMESNEEGFAENEAEVGQTFIEQFEDQMRTQIDSYLAETNREMPPSTRNNVFLDAQNSVLANFELYDPRAHTTNQVRSRLQSVVTDAVNARFQAMQTDSVINQPTDPRFDLDAEYAEPLRTQEDVYLEVSDPLKIDPQVSGSIREGITSIETGIDPVFMSTSTLIPFLSNLPNRPMSAEQAMDIIGIKEDGNWFKPSKSDKAVTDRVREAVDSHVASFLQDRKNRNQPVTREEIANVFYDHLSRFKTIKTEGEDTEHGGTYKHELPEMFEHIEDVELWTMYDARIPITDNIDTSAYYNTMSDSTHNPHGKGTNFWVRGDVIENTNTGRTGLVLQETQAQIHEHAQDPTGYQEVYLRDVSREDEADITPIRNKIDTMRKATRKLAGEIVANETRLEEGFPLTETMGLKQANYIAEVLTDSTDTNPMQEADLFIGRKGYQYDRNIESALREVSPKYGEKWQQVYDKYDEIRAEALRDSYIREQPFAELYGITLKAEDFRPIKPASDPFFGSRMGAIIGDVQKKLKETGNDLDADALTEPEAENVKKHTLSLYSDSQDSAREGSDGNYLALHKEYIPLLAQTYPTVRDVGLLAESFPTPEEMERLKEFDRTRYDTPTVPNYPFPKNWPSMSVRTGVINAIDRDLDDVYIISQGEGGAPTSVYKQDQKAARQIAQQIADITGEDVNDLYSMVPDTEDSPGGPYFALDIRSLKELIKQKRWPGFKGYKKGGLVTKAQGAGYSMNYGDYGRSYK